MHNKSLPSEEQKAEIIAQYGIAQDHGLVDIHAEMSIDFGSVLLLLAIGVTASIVVFMLYERIRKG